MNQRELAINQAKAWLGKKEKDGSHKEIIDTYNSLKPLPNGHKMTYTAPWCASFVGAVAQATGLTNIIPCSTSCNTMIDLAKKMGIWVEDDSYTPKTADIIMYDWDDNGKGDNKGKADHVGYVEKVTNKTITVIEGNKSNAVGRRSLKVNGKYIRGYICPKYDDVVAPKPAPKNEEVKTTTKTYTCCTVSSNLRIRTEPNVKNNKNIIGYIPKGKQFVSTKQENGWAYGTYKNIKGWACMKYLK